MIAGLTLDEVCEKFGSGKTKTKRIVEILGSCGISCGSRRVRGWPEKKETAILYFTIPGNNNARWVLWDRGKFYDPDTGVHCKRPKYLGCAEMLSHLKVEIEDENNDGGN